jgi:hypothetical protein
MTHYHLLTKTKYDGHRSLVMIDFVPNWFERTILRMKAVTMRYVGLGSKWKILTPDNRLIDIKDKKMILVLEAVEGGVNLKQRVLKKHRGITLKKALPVVLLMLVACGQKAQDSEPGTPPDHFKATVIFETENCICYQLNDPRTTERNYDAYYDPFFCESKREHHSCSITGNR